MNNIMKMNWQRCMLIIIPIIVMFPKEIVTFVRRIGRWLGNVNIKMPMMIILTTDCNAKV